MSSLSRLDAWKHNSCLAALLVRAVQELNGASVSFSDLPRQYQADSAA